MQPDEVDGGSRPRPSPRVLSVELDGEAVLYHENSRSVTVLNPTATLVWQLLDGSTTIDELALELAQAFSVDPAIVTQDVLEAARGFARQHLLDGSDPPGPADECDRNEVGPIDA